LFFTRVPLPKPELMMNYLQNVVVMLQCGGSRSVLKRPPKLHELCPTELLLFVRRLFFDQAAEMV
jgi:hypothetical protein